MKYLDWNEVKNLRLKTERGICFEDVQTALEEDRMIGDIPHPNSSSYSKQRVLLVEIDNYAYAVPYVEDEEKLFLKTLYPSRKLTKKYLM